MMRRYAWVVAVGLVGCGSSGPPLSTPQPAPAPGWADESEELRFLQSQANPTPEQFRRREQLQAQAESRERTRRNREQATEAAHVRADADRFLATIDKARKLDGVADIVDSGEEWNVATKRGDRVVRLRQERGETIATLFDLGSRSVVERKTFPRLPAGYDDLDACIAGWVK